jgi:hypothetical protein
MATGAAREPRAVVPTGAALDAMIARSRVLVVGARSEPPAATLLTAVGARRVLRRVSIWLVSSSRVKRLPAAPSVALWDRTATTVLSGTRSRLASASTGPTTRTVTWANRTGAARIVFADVRPVTQAQHLEASYTLRVRVARLV